MQYAENNLIPYFQPIIGIDSNFIYGFEVLGRYYDEKKAIQSLSDFFDSSDISVEEKIEADRIIRKKAIEAFLEADSSQYLFINMKLDWLRQYEGKPEEMPTIKFAKEYGVDLSRIVIELDEADCLGLCDKCMTCLSYYKSAGFRIAIDKYGKHSSIDALAVLAPDIIKIDMSLVQKSDQFHQYCEFLKTTVDFAQKLGIEVVYVGVETEEQLDCCMNSKGRYYQGFLLSKPLEDIKSAMFNDQIFKFATYKLIAQHQMSASKERSLHRMLDEAIDNYFVSNPYDKYEIDDYLAKLANILPENAIRAYICNKYGYQISSNVEIGTKTVSLVDYRNRNWSWRKYFTNALRVIANPQDSFLSEEYRDVTTKEKVSTYIRKISDDDFIFIDISKNA
ncbi:MAG: EAL domain-containing protein [Clostridia bacterium]|nr:EAL domain-containing protein [Clostridia bacterium]